MKPKATHTTFYRGKRINVKLRSGEEYEDVYLGKASKFIILQEHGKVRNKDLRAVTLAR